MAENRRPSVAGGARSGDEATTAIQNVSSARSLDSLVGIVEMTVDNRIEGRLALITGASGGYASSAHS